MTQRDGEPHKLDYTRVGSRPVFYSPVLAGQPEDIVYPYVNSGFTVADIAAPLTSELNSAYSAPNGSAPVRKFTAL